MFTTNMYLEETFPKSAPGLVIFFQHFRCVCTKKKPVVSEYMISSTLKIPVRYFGEKTVLENFSGIQ